MRPLKADPKVGRRKNQRHVVEMRREKVADLYAKGFSQAYIGQQFGVSQVQISQDLAAIWEEWRASSLQDFDARKAEELAKINHLERVAWEAWERSCEDAEFKRRKVAKVMSQPKDRKGNPVGKPTLVVTGEDFEETTKGRDGDDRFLARVAWCIEMRCKVFGLVRENKVVNNQVNVLPEDFWDRLSRSNPDEKWEDAEILRLAAAPEKGDGKK